VQSFPHQYVATASSSSTSLVSIATSGIEAIEVAPPPEFGGPEHQWSPEVLLMSAVSSCFILSFRAIARASNLEWISLECVSAGTLDKPERSVWFTDVESTATLRVPPGVDQEKAKRLLERAEQTCFVSNTLKSKLHLKCQILEVN
jgi:organic hydroperoxide reductase OsmC/OhrA